LLESNVAVGLNLDFVAGLDKWVEQAGDNGLLVHALNQVT